MVYCVIDPLDVVQRSRRPLLCPVLRGIPPDYTQAAVNMSQPYDVVANVPYFASVPVSWPARWAEFQVNSHNVFSFFALVSCRLVLHAGGLAARVECMYIRTHKLQKGVTGISIMHMERAPLQEIRFCGSQSLVI